MIERKCLHCGTWNNDEIHCKNCGVAINPKEIDRLAHLERIEAEKNKPKDKFDLFVERCKNHRLLIVRIFYKIGYSISMVLGAIGAFLAWLTAMANA